MNHTKLVSVTTRNVSRSFGERWTVGGERGGANMPAYVAAAVRAQRERNERMVVTGARLRVHLVCTPCLLLPLSSPANEADERAPSNAEPATPGEREVHQVDHGQAQDRFRLPGVRLAPAPVSPSYADCLRMQESCQVWTSTGCEKCWPQWIPAAPTHRQTPRWRRTHSPLLSRA